MHQQMTIVGVQVETEDETDKSRYGNTTKLRTAQDAVEVKDRSTYFFELQIFRQSPTHFNRADRSPITGSPIIHAIVELNLITLSAGDDNIGRQLITTDLLQQINPRDKKHDRENDSAPNTDSDLCPEKDQLIFIFVLPELSCNISLAKPSKERE
jgi:hypothetical protein